MNKILGILVGLAAFAMAFYLIIVILTGDEDLPVKIILVLVVMVCVYSSFMSFASLYLFPSNHQVIFIVKEGKMETEKNEMKYPGYEDELKKLFSPFNRMLFSPHPWNLDEIKEILSECKKAEDYAWVHSIVTAFISIPDAYKNKTASYEYSLSNEVLDFVSLELHKAVDALWVNEEMDKGEKDMQIQWTYLFLSPPWGIVEDTEERKALSKKLKDKSKELFPGDIKIHRSSSFNAFEWNVGMFGCWG